ncbi:c-type cytochrome [Fulvimonas soli]|uniref:Cytochrome c553 n=1 Tax=Fulvimonas soli TaxID=155197 RepID=A0A316I313_9GAMM|nr:c-type cytochrome [Fulvimonas soli]PWK86766.1 cytochrome c553 [Fulvimonas soli]TNY27097.1 cytochrome C [Fulvimonas soli]
MTRTSILLLAMALAVAAAGRAQDAATAASAAAPAAPFADLRRQAPVRGDAQAGAGKATVCAACHGPQGVAVAPTFPNLAGQSATYLYVQLKQFKEGQRRDPVMSGQAAPLSDADMRDLAAYYASLAPKPAGPADESSRGAQLYAAGDPANGIPPCQGCHGADAQGPRPVPNGKPQPPWASFPHLRGQSAIYLAKALGDYKSGARADNSNARVMQGVAQTLGDEDVQALGAYLSTR